MARFHATPKGKVPFTPEEEAEWDAREAAALAKQAIEDAAKAEREKHKGKEFKNLSSSEKDELLETLCKEAGLI